ncbi:Ribonuclease MRP protein subunit-like protein [Hapsidospora chrysogenum ATCC 11550]|uniref:Ribonuclease MRP protein subunit-like protein n=1 Tax=Hapsidospora chrysogenum (strain ATCC 11550 / CBS 779.69 / DSM 880 / IAM 14645 / JCM 23072 / IMI 49137) TaxID=857340 RepID=A0A086T199_HAPC1|nr:Ribonuclease MRP protein subunit-like protein [Hapsidospora chrysogenum ATCC 11550]
MKSTSSKRPAGAPSSTIVTTAIRGDLSPLLPILEAFNHRNKNQHRASHWWSHFSILRRSLRSLLASGQNASASRASWLRDRIIPRAYMQHAPLGLLLLTILARVRSVLSEHLPPPPPERSARRDPTPLASTAASPPHSSIVADRGVVVSRSDTALAAPAADKKPLSNPRAVAGSPPGPDKPKKKKKSNSKRSNKTDELSSLFGSLG